MIFIQPVTHSFFNIGTVAKYANCVITLSFHFYHLNVHPTATFFLKFVEQMFHRVLVEIEKSTGSNTSIHPLSIIE